MAYGTGIRVEELQRITWQNVDFKKRQIDLPGSITKTGRPRTVGLPSDFKLKPGRPDQRLFVLGNYRRPWRKACVAVGAGHWEETEKGRKKYVGVLLRHTRHTAIRDMVDAGIDRDRAKASSGHLTDSMFTRYNIGKDQDVDRTRTQLESYRKAAR